jgi:hypothetical protein
MLSVESRLMTAPKLTKKKSFHIPGISVLENIKNINNIVTQNITCYLL